MRSKKTYRQLYRENIVLKKKLDAKNNNSYLLNQIKFLNDKLKHSKSLVDYLFAQNDKSLKLCDRYSENFNELNRFHKSIFKEYIISLIANAVLGVIILALLFIK